MMTKSLHCVSLEIRNMPYYYGLTDVDKFFDAFEREVIEKLHFQALDWATTPARWWSTHVGPWKVMRKCRTDELLASMVALTE